MPYSKWQSSTAVPFGFTDAWNVAESKSGFCGSATLHRRRHDDVVGSLSRAPSYPTFRYPLRKLSSGRLVVAGEAASAMAQG